MCVYWCNRMVKVLKCTLVNSGNCAIAFLGLAKLHSLLTTPINCAMSHSTHAGIVKAMCIP